MSPRQLWVLLKKTYQEWTEDKASRLAAALSYYAAVSIAPLLIIVLVVTGFLLGAKAAQGQLMAQIQGLIGQQGAQFIETIIANADKPTTGSIAGILSLVTLVWGSTNVFTQLQEALNTIWDVELKSEVGLKHTAQRRLLSFALVLGIGFLLLLSLLLSTALAAIAGSLSGLVPGFDRLWQIGEILLSLVVITFLFGILFKILPDVEITWGDVWPGAAVTALLFTIGKFALSFYLGNQGSAYGAAGSLVVFLLWVYYSAQIFFFGAEFTQVYANHYGSGIQPTEDATYANHVVQET